MVVTWADTVSGPVCALDSALSNPFMWFFCCPQAVYSRTCAGNIQLNSQWRPLRSSRVLSVWYSLSPISPRACELKCLGFPWLPALFPQFRDTAGLCLHFSSLCSGKNLFPGNTFGQSLGLTSFVSPHSETLIIYVLKTIAFIYCLVF